MSIWDDYKTSVRTRINVKQDRLLLTERQWKLKHYDLRFLSANAIGAENSKATVIDVMQDFADIYGEWSDKYGCNKWQKLTKCAEYYGYDWENDTAHDSLADCRATLYCYKKMLKE